MRYELKGKFGKQHGRTMFAGLINSKDLTDLWERKLLVVDAYSTTNPEGYQRKESPPRSRKVARYAKDQIHGIIPTAITIYSRTPNGGIIEEDGKFFLDDHMLAREAQDYTERIGESPVTDKTVLYVADGQHRVAGFSFAVKNGWINTAENDEYDVPIVILFWNNEEDVGKAKLEEAAQFHTINTEQKRMKTDLSYKYLFEKHQAEADIIDDKTKIPYGLTRKENLPYSAYLGKYLSESVDSPLHGKITPINETRASSGTMISESSLIDSLGPVIKYVSDNGMTMGQAKTVLANFWGAIKELMPEAFDEKPNEFVLLKTPGIYSLHHVLPVMLQRKNEVMGIVPTVEQFKEVMDDVGTVFSDKYWSTEVGEEDQGVASSFGAGAKAFTMLAQAIVEEIPA